MMLEKMCVVTPVMLYHNLTKVGVANEMGSVLKIKRDVMTFFAWICKRLRCFGSALVLAYDFFFDSI